MTETIFEKHLVHVQSTNMEEAELMTARAVQMIWLFFVGAVMSSIFVYSLWFKGFPIGLCGGRDL